MEHQRFDSLTATFAHAVSRRGALRALVGGLAGGLLRFTARGSAAQPGTCLGAGQACGPRHGCCSHTCCGGICCGEDEKCLGRRRRRSRETEAGPICCPESQIAVDRCCAPGEIGCFKTCCPPETIACGAPTKLPDGTHLPGTCVCPEGTVYRDGACVCPMCRTDLGCCTDGVGKAPSHDLGIGPCGPDLPCCHGTCAGGTCRRMIIGEPCDEDADCYIGLCLDGVCQTAQEGGATCVSPAYDCPAGQLCAPGLGSNGDPSEGRCVTCEAEAMPCLLVAGGSTVTGFLRCPAGTAPVCCPAIPDSGFAGAVYCCVPGENCPGDSCAPTCPSEMIQGEPNACLTE
jgi:hypothetical protein